MLDQVVPVLPKEFCTKIEQMPTKCPPFLGSMLSQYMALFVRFVSFRLFVRLSKKI